MSTAAASTAAAADAARHAHSLHLRHSEEADGAGARSTATRSTGPSCAAWRGVCVVAAALSTSLAFAAVAACSARDSSALALEGPHGPP
eukprot:3408543-Pleurochrysis_carterae.AAC.1